jgi:hypothetical protein
MFRVTLGSYTLVLYGRWSESRDQLHNHRNLLPVGGKGPINVVILVKWTRSTGARV